MKKFNSLRDQKNSTNSFSKKFLIPLTIVLSMLWTDNIKAKNSASLADVLKYTTTINIDDIDKEEVARRYLENNLFIKWESITHQDFEHSITNMNNDIYEIKYSHEFEWISGFSEKSKKDIKIKVKFSYKNNNIYIEFQEVAIGWSKLQDNWTLILDNTVYDYDISQWENKSIEISSKANKQKTLEMIKGKIKKVWFISQSNVEEIKKHENTQITKLNDIALWNEVMWSKDSFYREIFFTEKWQYRPIWKIYFDKYGVLDLDKTNSELKSKDVIVLWSKISFDEIENSWNNITFSISQESIENLESNVAKHRELLINIIDKAKVWPNKEFTWFNKKNEKRVWSEKEERLFDTKLINLELIDDTYVFTWWDKTQKIFFWVEWEGENSKVFLKNENNQKVSNFYVTIKNNYYKVNLQDNELAIYKIKKEELNITNNLPSFSGDKNLVQLLENKDINTYHNWSHLEYFSNKGDLVTSIPCSKSEKWEYKLNKANTNVDANELYRHPDFKQITEEIKKHQKKLNTLDINILQSFETLLQKEWVKLDSRNLIAIADKNWVINYCKIDEKKNSLNIKLDENLYGKTKKALETLKSRLKIVEMLDNTNVRWMNSWKKEDFTKFVWWGWGIGTRFISQNNIINFISKSTNEIFLDILRWEWQITKIIYEVSPKSFKIKRQGKPTVTISGQIYTVKVSEKWDVYLDPVEKK